MDWADQLALDVICEVLDAPKNGYKLTREAVAEKLRQTYDEGHCAGYNLGRESYTQDWLAERESA